VLLWAAILALAWTVGVAVSQGKVKGFSVKGVIEALFPNVFVAAVVAFVVFAAIGKVTSSFVDVVRYLDTSPRSYEVRRAIRGGMVDLLRNLHATDKYSRVIIVAHSLGGFIAYDALSSFWDETDRGQDRDIEFAKLADLESAAQTLLHRPANPCPATADALVGGTPTGANYGPKDPLIITLRAAQLALWNELRENEINWRVTDFITVGTPMYMADLLFTKNHDRFEELKKRAELPQCPPRSDSETVEGPTPTNLMYGRREDGDIRRRLVTGSPFAVVRWSNLWFPTLYGIFGDPFGGSLAALFGAGIDDRAVTADEPGRYIPLWAHMKYFSCPDRIGPDFVAPVIRTALALEYPNPPVMEATPA
jgi:pimeloyl-ACP methyl ester carboxylesterase